MLLPLYVPNLKRRLWSLLTGILLFGTGLGLMLNAGLGLPPWDVLHQGLAASFGLTIGTWTILLSGIILLLWLPLRESYGIGTLLNACLIGITLDVSSFLLPEPTSPIAQYVMLASGILTVGLASGLYIGAGLGPGPRDGLMTGIARLGPSIRLVRTTLEVAVLIIGWLLGGTVGIGTVLFALSIGPLVQVALRIFQQAAP